jgi:hypothetical protein
MLLQKIMEKPMENPIDSTQTPRRGWLKNGNPPGDPNTAPRCGAKTRRGTACQSPAMRNGRCRMHGGTSTGPRTPEGLARSRRSRWKHGLYSSESRAEQKRLRELIRQSRELLKQL